jgi:hypothetical protein
MYYVGSIYKRNSGDGQEGGEIPEFHQVTEICSHGSPIDAMPIYIYQTICHHMYYVPSICKRNSCDGKEDEPGFWNKSHGKVNNKTKKTEVNKQN